jgi:hypothetical protein
MSCGPKKSQLVLNMYDSSFRSRNRSTIVKSWNTSNKGGVKTANRAITPFRALNNAGDALSRMHYNCGGSNQVSNVNKNQGLSLRGTMQAACDNSGIPAANCNTKFVFDSSDYVTYQRNKAIQKLYNDTSFGGSNNGHVSALRHVRR